MSDDFSPIDNDKEMLDLAYQMYMQYKSRKEIMENTGLSESKIKYYVSKSWFQEREIIRRDLIKNLQKGNNLSLNKINTYGLQIIENTLKSWKTEDKVLNFHEAIAISKILSNLEKLNTDDEKSDSYIEINSKNSDFSEEKIQEILSSDPFLNNQLSVAYDASTTTGSNNNPQKKEN